MNNNLTKGDNSPIINGNNNSVNGNKKLNVITNKELAFGIGGFVTGIVTSLLANWIWDIFC